MFGRVLSRVLMLVLVQADMGRIKRDFDREFTVKHEQHVARASPPFFSYQDHHTLP